MAEVIITVSDKADGSVKIRTQFVPPLQENRPLTDAQCTGHFLMCLLEQNGEDGQSD